jgi:hypothetical protein
MATSSVSSSISSTLFIPGMIAKPRARERGGRRHLPNFTRQRAARTYAVLPSIYSDLQVGAAE